MPIMAIMDELSGTQVFDLIFHNIRNENTTESRGLTKGRS